MTYELPASYDPDDNKSVDVPRALIPLIAGQLRGLESGNAWREDDQVAGPQAALLVQERLLNDTISPPPNYQITDHLWLGDRGCFYLGNPITPVGVASQWETSEGIMAAGTESRWCPLWDGSQLFFSGEQWLLASIPYASPVTLLAVVIRSAWGGIRRIFDGGTNQGALYMNTGVLAIQTPAHAISSSLPQNKRSCIIGVVDGNHSILRVNGVETSGTLGDFNSTSFRIGTYGNGSGQFWIGSISCVYVAPNRIAAKSDRDDLEYWANISFKLDL